MSDIRFNRWLHQSGTGGVYQDSTGSVGIGTSVPTTLIDIQGGSLKIGNHTLSSSSSSLNINGNVSIGGTLTYEDVTNIDSVGIITAQSGLHVTGGSVGIGITNPNVKLHLIGNTEGTASAGTRVDVARLVAESYSPINSGGMTLGAIWHNTDVNQRRAYIQSSQNTNPGSTARDLLLNPDGGNIGIGTDNPDERLEVGDGTVSGALKVSGQSSSVTSDGFTVDWESSSNSTRFFSEPSSGGNSLIRFFTTNSGTRGEKLRIDEVGRVTMPAQPAFYAYRNSTSGQLASGDYVFNNVATNRGSHYDTSNGRFTAPVAGAYFFSCVVQLYGSQAAGGHVSFRVNGTDFMGSQNSSNPVYDEIAGVHDNIYFSAVITLAANEYVTVWRSFTTRGMQSYFTGYLIG